MKNKYYRKKKEKSELLTGWSVAFSMSPRVVSQVPMKSWDPSLSQS